MSFDYDRLYSKMAKQMQFSAIRKLAPLITPNTINFGGGWPSPKLFPVEETSQICNAILSLEGQSAMQYGDSKGDRRLREVIRQRATEKQQIKFTEEDDVMITTGGQQGVYLLGIVFLDPGDLVAVEAPTYATSLGAFQAFGVEVEGIPMDKDGLRTDALEETLDEFQNVGRRLKLIYVIPDFQNPSGVTMKLDRRQRLVELAEQYDFLIVEDSPYTELRYEGEPIPPIYTLDTSGRTVFLGSFSKIFAPVRVGWLIGPKDLVVKLAAAKSQIDLCTPSLTQSIVYHFCSYRNLLGQQIEKIKQDYGDKRNLMLQELERHMPQPEVTWTTPEGGMFIWVTLPEGIDTEEMVYDALNENVAFVLGSAFYPKGVPKNQMRLSFATPSQEGIEVGIERLAGVVKRHL